MTSSMQPDACCVRSFQAPRLEDTEGVLANTAYDRRHKGQAWLPAPCDLQAVKASGVTFVASMLERVIEEQARGDASRAAAVRAAVISDQG